jgi:hypothetical protein
MADARSSASGLWFWPVGSFKLGSLPLPRLNNRHLKVAPTMAEGAPDRRPRFLADKNVRAAGERIAPGRALLRR